MTPVNRIRGTASPLPVVVARMLAPVFSVKHPEAYQSYAAVPLPLPSTLVGALGRAIALEGWCRGSAECYGEALRLAPVARPLAPGGPVAVSSVVFRVRKILESGGEKPGGENWHAMHVDRRAREYIVTRSHLYALYVPRRGEEGRVAQLVSMIDRLGDSESHVTVEAVVAEARRAGGGAVDGERGLCFDVALVARLSPGPPGGQGLDLDAVEPGTYVTVVPGGCEASRLANKGGKKRRSLGLAAYLLPLRPVSAFDSPVQVYEPSCIRVEPVGQLEPCIIEAWGRVFTVPCSLLEQASSVESGTGCVL